MPRFSITLTEKDYKQLQKQSTINCRSMSEEITYLIRNQKSDIPTSEPFTLPKPKCVPVSEKEIAMGLEIGVQELKHRCAVAGTKLPPPIDEKSRIPVNFKVTPTEYNLIQSIKERERIDSLNRGSKICPICWGQTLKLL